MEYFALGIPVLSTRLPDVERIQGPTRLATTEGEFCTQLQAILNDSSFEAKEAFAVAERNAWKRRAEELSTFVDGLS